MDADNERILGKVTVLALSSCLLPGMTPREHRWNIKLSEGDELSWTGSDRWGLFVLLLFLLPYKWDYSFIYVQLKPGLILLTIIYITCCHTEFFLCVLPCVSLRMESPQHLYQPAPLFDPSHGRKLIFVFGWNFTSFNLCLFCLVPSLDTTEKTLVPSLLPPIRY